MLLRSNLFRLVTFRKISSDEMRQRTVVLRRIVALGMIIVLFPASLTPAIAGALVKETVSRTAEGTAALLRVAADHLHLRGARGLGFLARVKSDDRSRAGNTQQGQNRGMPPLPTNQPGVRPQRPLTKSERETKVASIAINPSRDVILRSGEPMVFSAKAIDDQGNTIQGLQFEWESSDKEVASVTKYGQVTAGKPGKASITVKAGKAKESVRVTVVEGSKEDFGGKKKENSKRTHPRTSRSISDPQHVNALVKLDSNQRKKSSGKRRGAHARVPALGTPPEPLLPLRDPDDDPLPDGETPSLYSASNSLGSPPGKKTPGAQTPPAATSGTESPGSENFTFGIPVTSLPGRGMDISLDLVYNGRAFNKSTDPSNGATWMTYDVDSGWPAPGFRLGYGQIEDQGTYGFTLTDADGTRHALVNTSANNYDTTDGTFIHFYGGSGWGSLYYSDGTRVDYGAAGGGIRSYPTRIVDRNGNYILISYVDGVGPRISSIQDTLNRHIYFYYAGNGDLVTITSPGLGVQAERQVIRFYYQDVTVNQSGLFQSNINVSAPATAHVIQYIYLPNSTEGGTAHLGYRYDYSAYGMIYQIAQLRGMTASTDALDQTGSISSEGTQAALTTYNYPTTPSNLADAPSYTRRTDDWVARMTGMPGSGEAPYSTFAVDQTNGVSTVTAPDGTVTETHSIVAPAQWNDGLVNQIIVKQGASGATLGRTDITWEQDANGSNARPQQVQVTNDAGQTTTTVYAYSSYNNVTVASSRGFDGAEVRRVETDYQTNTAWTNRHLLHLPTSVKVFAGGASVPASRVDYAYDTAGTNLTPRNDIVMHESAFDPFATDGSYDPATDQRGNVTNVTTYTDAANGGGAITHATSYDIAGNVITAQVDCCQQKSFSYSGNYYYAYPTSVTSGAGPTLTSNTSYDFNTGVVATTTDENGQVNYFYYNADSLRPEHVDYPDGGAVNYGYNETLYADAAGRLHYYAYTSTKLDPSRLIYSFRFFDGRGAVTQTFDNYTLANGYSTQDIEYDAMGRAYRTSNPYYAAAYVANGLNTSGLWTTSTFDNLGRVTRVDMPSGDAQNATTTYATTDYAGIYTTVTDQTGRQRRQKTDALGRMVRLDEPDINGNLGSTDAPNQYTAYDYDALDNLIHIAQGVQHRYFKYDSLSRLNYERQVEQDAPHYAADSVTGNSYWSRRIDYNSQGLVQDAYDARQIHTHFDYDGLNRVTQINYTDSTPAAFYWYDSQGLPPGAPNYDHGYANARLIAMTYGGITATTGNYFGYDQMGRVLTHQQVTGANTYAMSYGYNFAGLLTGENYPTSRALSYAYDEGGRLSQVSDGTTTYASGFAYEPHGGLTAETFGNGAVHSVAYNRALQASEIKLKQSANGTELQRFNYAYGVVNQADGSVDTTRNNGQIGRIDGYVSGAKQWDQRFTYDSLSRLSTAGEYRGDNGQQSWQTHYDYDLYGNRFQYQANSNVGYTPVQPGDIDAARNRFIESGATPTSYDPAGNIISDAKFRGMNYNYDANGRMTFAEHGDHSSPQNSIYDCAGQRVQTTAGVTTRQMVYDIFGQNIADYANGALERENVYRGGQLLAVVETGSGGAAVPAGLATTTMSTQVDLSWSAAVGATNYRIERKSAGSDYGSLGMSATTSFTDNGVSAGSAYLYRVCAADGAGNCTSAYSNIALGAPFNFPTDPTIVSFAEDPQNATPIKAEHITELRTAVNAVRHLAGLGDGNWTHLSVGTGDLIAVEDVRDLRVNLDEALGQLGIQMPPYDPDATLTGYHENPTNATTIKATHIRQLRQRATSGTGTGSGGDATGGVKYVLSDLQGSTRAVMNNNGVGTSGVIARHDYLPFGEEIGSGVGLRNSSQSYGAIDNNRFKYGLTEHDSTTGLDHTWWRKYDNAAGRFTSPDPALASMNVQNPQSFNRYSYVHNDPVNFVDPSGLLMVLDCQRLCVGGECGPWTCTLTSFGGPVIHLGEPPPRGGGGGGGGINQRPKKERPLIIEKPKKPRAPAWKSQAEKQRDYETCVHREMKELNIELAQLMNTNLDLMIGGDILALPISPLGLNGYNLLSLTLWRLDLADFNRRYEPARQESMKKCRKEVGLN